MGEAHYLSLPQLSTHGFWVHKGKEEKEISLRIHHSEMQEVPAGDILFLK